MKPRGGWRPARPNEVPAPLPAGGALLNRARGETPESPLSHPVEIAQKLRELCGAEGYRIEGGQLLALRWDLDGNEVLIRKFDLGVLNG